MVITIQELIMCKTKTLIFGAIATITLMAMASCSSEELSVQEQQGFDNLKFVVNVQNETESTRAASDKREWDVGDKIIAAIEGDDNNLCHLEYKGKGHWSVSPNNGGTHFPSNKGVIYAVHADSLELDDDAITTGGDVLYTQNGSYEKRGNVVMINLEMNHRPVCRISIVGMDSSCHIDGLEEYTCLKSISKMEWVHSDVSHGLLNKEIYGDTCVFYGVLKPKDNGHTEVVLTNSEGATYKRVFVGKTMESGSHIVFNGPNSAERDKWDCNVPVVGISQSSAQITMSEGTKKNISECYNLRPAMPSNPSVSAISSSPDVVKVNEDGTIEALSKGETTLTITTIDGGHKCDIHISVLGIVDFINMNVISTSLMSTPWGDSSALTISISNNSDETVFLETLGGLSIGKELPGKESTAYSISSRFRDITKENHELVFTYKGKT